MTPPSDRESPARPRPSPALVRALGLVCLAFAGVGLLVALAGSTAVFAPWRHAAAEALLHEPDLPARLEPFVALTLAILGGSIVGKWTAAAWLVWRPLADGRRWAWRALVVGLLAWFGLDSSLSLALGARFNVWMINLAPLIVFGGLLVPARAATRPDPEAAVTPIRAFAALRWVCLGFAGFGVVVAVSSHTWLFGFYQRAIADAWFHGTLEEHAWIWLRFSYALIGATFLAHFLMLALALRHAAGQRWVLHAVMSSMLGWFLVDATLSAAHGAWFNVWMIDVPSLLAVALPWLLARRALPSSEASARS
ncbi:hypothetical protein [Paraliomyxa miuraensis]|uniref:hypothetical protein n=1 Tax=Paraliomyxa miuraensis TaxID=376150 RepID=UPI002257FD75|nr:hypothetical protein [Paraliomyxa miuraensis]MCX4246280.1 hypothetical protein [Paraliomyxa miuraensis]